MEPREEIQKIQNKRFLNDDPEKMVGMESLIV